MSANEVLQELTKVARANMADYIRAFATGDAVEYQWLKDLTAALAEVSVETIKADGDLERQRARFRLHSKIDALELLGKHHKLYVERHEHNYSDGSHCLPVTLLAPSGPRV